MHAQLSIFDVDKNDRDRANIFAHSKFLKLCKDLQSA